MTDPIMGSIQQLTDGPTKCRICGFDEPHTRCPGPPLSQPAKRETPNLDKIAKHRAAIDAIADFMNWICDHKGLALAQDSEFGIIPLTGVTPAALIAEHFGIDLQAAEKEEQG